MTTDKCQQIAVLPTPGPALGGEVAEALHCIEQMCEAMDGYGADAPKIIRAELRRLQSELERMRGLRNEAQTTIGSLLAVIDEADDMLLDPDDNAACYREGRRIYKLIDAARREESGEGT